jgi:hypothetical protein
MRDGLSRQMATMAGYQVQQAIESIEKKFGPVSEFVETQRRDQMKKDFFKKHPDLEPFEAVAMSVASQVQANAQQAGRTMSIDEAFQAVAEQTKAVLAKANIVPGASNGATQGGQQTNTNGTHKMQTLSRGGQGGAGQGAQTLVQKSPGARALS